MIRRAIVAAAVVVAVGAGSISAGITDDANPGLADGRYLGYVRRVDAAGIVAVDLADGAPELRVDAGLLADLDLLESAPHPFHIVVQHHTIVELDTADDALPDVSRRAAWRGSGRRAASPTGAR
jgi:hypothetical protein